MTSIRYVRIWEFNLQNVKRNSPRWLALVAMGTLLGWGNPRLAAQEGSAPEVFQLANSYFQKRDIGRAATCYKNVLARLENEGASFAPMIEVALFRYAICLYQLSYFTEAAGEFAKYQTKFPDGKSMVDAELYHAMAMGASGRGAEAIPLLEAFLKKHPDSPRKNEAQMRLAASFTDAGQFDRAMASWRKCLESFDKTQDRGNLIPRQRSDALAMLLSSCVGAGHAREACDVVRQIREAKLPPPSNILLREQTLLRLGDGLLRNGFSRSALGIYKECLSAERIQDALRTQMEDAQARQDHVQQGSLKKQTAVLEKAAGYNDALLLRMAQAYTALGRPREAAISYQEVLRRGGKSPEHEHAIIGVARGQLSQGGYADALTTCETFLQTFPQSPLVEQALHIQLQAMMADRRPSDAVKIANRLLADFPKSPLAERALFSRGFCEVMGEQFSAALQTFQDFDKNHSQSLLMEEALYWKAMSLFRLRDYARAKTSFEQFHKKYPQSARAPECDFRLATCFYALGEMEPALKRLQTWLAANPKNPLRSEALSLLGDLQLATRRVDDALQTFRKILPGDKEAFIHGIFQQGRCLQINKKWDDAAVLYLNFIREFDNHPRVMEAARLAGNSLVKQGKSDEAEALYWNALQKSGENRAVQNVRPLLMDLAQLTARREGSEAVSLKFSEFAKEQRRKGRMRTAAMLEAAGAEYLFRMRKKEEADRILEHMARTYEFKDLAADAAAAILDFHSRRGDVQRAAVMARVILQDASKKEIWDAAHYQLGCADLSDRKWENALEQFDAALRAVPASPRTARIQLKRAQCLESLNQHQRAVEACQFVLASRDARGSSWAEALLIIASCAEKTGDPKKAAAYYQRIYVLYRAYPEILAKAYLGGGRCFEKLNMPSAAIKTYEEMVSRADLKDLPEMTEVRQRLAKLEEPR